MKFTEYLVESEINEMFGMMNKEDKQMVKDAMQKAMPDISKVTLNKVHDTLALMAKQGNAMAKKLIKSLGFNPDMAEPIYLKATK